MRTGNVLSGGAGGSDGGIAGTGTLNGPHGYSGANTLAEAGRLMNVRPNLATIAKNLAHILATVEQVEGQSGLMLAQLRGARPETDKYVDPKSSGSEGHLESLIKLTERLMRSASQSQLNVGELNNLLSLDQ